MVVSAVCSDTCRRSVVDALAVEPAVEFGLHEVDMEAERNIGNAVVVRGDV